MSWFTHKVLVHFRHLTPGISFQEHFESAEEVYAQYGIKFEFASGMSLKLTQDQLERLDVVDGSCEWTITEGEYDEVHRMGPLVFFNQVTVFYINQFRSGKIGCGGHRPGQPACIVSSLGSKWTTAHEVGHVLLTRHFKPAHTSDTENLMYGDTRKITAALPSLTEAQVAQMKRSPCCIPI